MRILTGLVTLLTLSIPGPAVAGTFGGEGPGVLSYPRSAMPTPSRPKFLSDAASIARRTEVRTKYSVCEQILAGPKNAAALRLFHIQRDLILLIDKHWKYITQAIYMDAGQNRIHLDYDSRKMFWIGRVALNSLHDNTEVTLDEATFRMAMVLDRDIDTALIRLSNSFRPPQTVLEALKELPHIHLIYEYWSKNDEQSRVSLAIDLMRLQFRRPDTSPFADQFKKVLELRQTPSRNQGNGGPGVF